MLKIDLRIGDGVAIGSVATVRLEDKSGKRVSLIIDADKSVPITRINHLTPAQIASQAGVASSRHRK